jgi:hypothetical protein
MLKPTGGAEPRLTSGGIAEDSVEPFSKEAAWPVTTIQSLFDIAYRETEPLLESTTFTTSQS